MRGELDDALNRMARMEELQRRRAAEAAPDGRSAFDEVIEAVRRVVGQYPELRVALWAEDAGDGVGVRVEWSNGAVTVLLDDEGVAPTPALPAGAPSPRYALPPASGPADEFSDVGLPAPDEMPSAGGPPPSWSMPAGGGSAWTGTPESDTNESAARLAELIRQDPTLLRAPDGPYRQG